MLLTHLNKVFIQIFQKRKKIETESVTGTVGILLKIKLSFFFLHHSISCLVKVSS